jgi:hypothetical protein
MAIPSPGVLLAAPLTGRVRVRIGAVLLPPISTFEQLPSPWMGEGAGGGEDSPSSPIPAFARQGAGTVWAMVNPPGEGAKIANHLRAYEKVMRQTPWSRDRGFRSVFFRVLQLDIFGYNEMG